MRHSFFQNHNLMISNRTESIEHLNHTTTLSLKNSLQQISVNM